MIYRTAIINVIAKEIANQYHLDRHKYSKSCILTKSSVCFGLFDVADMLCKNNYFTNKTVMVVNKEARDIQKEVERTLFPLTVDWRARTELGSTYITSFCCR